MQMTGTGQNQPSRFMRSALTAAVTADSGDSRRGSSPSRCQNAGGR
jgi:hypothetical protein